VLSGVDVTDEQLLIILTRRPELARQIAGWSLPGVSLGRYESPSEALAALSTGRAGLFLFDTAHYDRYRHVVRKFVSMGRDTDLLVLGEEDVLRGREEELQPGIVRRLPVDVPPDELKVVIGRLLLLRQVRQRSGIAGRSPAVQEMLAMIAHAAPLDVNVLIEGESGTGKELVARAIHEHSRRSSRPFLSLNCGAMSEGVLESELFGHARGAFTGAVSAHAGVFQRADGGTLFLDEVAEMPLGMQTRFLRALETGEFTPVGGRQTLRSDIRLVAATLRDLAEEVESGRFRQDLYYRLRVIVIHTPPLRERKEDIPVLAQTFLEQEIGEHGLAIRGISRPAMDMLLAHDWPGNVRELRNTIRAAAVLKQRGMIEPEDLPEETRRGLGPGPGGRLPVPYAHDHDRLERELLMATLLEMREDIRTIKAALQEGGGRRGLAIPASGRIIETFSGGSDYRPLAGGEGGDLQAAERALISAALRATGGRRKQAAEKLGISERTLYRKIKRYGL
jgi:DNA-binding NtrC family response regulator